MFDVTSLIKPADHRRLYDILADEDEVESFRRSMEEEMSEAELEEWNRTYERVKGTGKVGVLQGVAVIRKVK